MQTRFLTIMETISIFDKEYRAVFSNKVLRNPCDTPNEFAYIRQRSSQDLIHRCRRLSTSASVCVHRSGCRHRSGQIHSPPWILFAPSYVDTRVTVCERIPVHHLRDIAQLSLANHTTVLSSRPIRCNPLF